jgi:hypothetical protein
MAASGSTSALRRTPRWSLTRTPHAGDGRTRSRFESQICRVKAPRFHVVEPPAPIVSGGGLRVRGSG